jgi:hypothetical protein
MNTIFAHRLSHGFEGHALDHYLRNYILRLRYHLPRLGLSQMGAVRFLLALEGALKNVHLVH